MQRASRDKIFLNELGHDQSIGSFPFGSVSQSIGTGMRKVSWRKLWLYYFWQWSLNDVFFKTVPTLSPLHGVLGASYYDPNLLLQFSLTCRYQYSECFLFCNQRNHCLLYAHQTLPSMFWFILLRVCPALILCTQPVSPSTMVHLQHLQSFYLFNSY